LQDAIRDCLHDGAGPAIRHFVGGAPGAALAQAGPDRNAMA
jgi:hypothetical protein